ncbi:hypothetical protein [uncultured Nostoc sp.]
MSNGDRSTSPSPARLHLWKISLLVVGAAGYRLEFRGCLEDSIVSVI